MCEDACVCHAACVTMWIELHTCVAYMLYCRLRPSHLHVCAHAHVICTGGAQDTIRAVAGPLARSTHDLTLILRTWLCDTMWDEDVYVPRLPFDMGVYDSERKLTIGEYMCCVRVCVR